MKSGKAAVSRRRFLRTGAVGAGAAASALAAPAVSGAVADRAEDAVLLARIRHLPWIWPSNMSSASRPCPAAASRSTCCRPARSSAPSRCMDALNDGVIDAAHTVPVYWYGKHKAASLFGTGPVFGGSADDDAGLVLPGRRQGLYRELTQDILGLNVVGFFGFPMPAQPFGWFKKRDQHRQPTSRA